MGEYHEHDAPSTSIMPAQDADQSVTLNAWQDFIADYKAELGDGKATFGYKPQQQSVNKEYSTYVMGALAAGSTSDALRFWRVSYFW